MTSVMRGSKKMHVDSSIDISRNGLEDLDQFFSSAKTPRSPTRKKSKPSKSRIRKQERSKKKSKRRRRFEKVTPKFSLDGNSNGNEVNSIEDFRSKLRKGVISPGDLSHVTTAPPTPKDPSPSQAHLEDTQNEENGDVFTSGYASLQKKSSTQIENEARATTKDNNNMSYSLNEVNRSLSLKGNAHDDEMGKKPTKKKSTMNSPSYDFPTASQMDDDMDDDMLPPSPPTDSPITSNNSIDLEEKNISENSGDLNIVDDSPVLFTESQSNPAQKENLSQSNESTLLDKSDKEGEAFDMLLPQKPIGNSPRDEDKMNLNPGKILDDGFETFSQTEYSDKNSSIKRKREDLKNNSKKDIDGEADFENSSRIESKSKASTHSRKSHDLKSRKKTNALKKMKSKESSKHDQFQTPTRQRTGEKQRNVTLFSPPGYPIANRDMEPVPVSNYRESPEGDEKKLRRSRRMRVKPLAFWKNERLVYGPHNEVGILGEEMGHMPVPKTVLTAMPTPRRQRKHRETKRKGRYGVVKFNATEEEKEFNSSRLRKRFNIIDGETAHVWDENIGDAVEQKVVSYYTDMQLRGTDLPLPFSRRKNEGKAVGVAAQAFNISSEEVAQPGYIMGTLCLPPKGIKDPETTGPCSQVFTICSCQAKSLEVIYGDPHEDEGSLNPHTAQRFLLSAGDQFRIPRANAYKLVNHSLSTESILAWTIIRPADSDA